jgi:hypothetical protein
MLQKYFDNKELSESVCLTSCLQFSERLLQ